MASLLLLELYCEIPSVEVLSSCWLRKTVTQRLLKLHFKSNLKRQFGTPWKNRVFSKSNTSSPRPNKLLYWQPTTTSSSKWFFLGCKWHQRTKCITTIFCVWLNQMQFKWELVKTQWVKNTSNYGSTVSHNAPPHTAMVWISVSGRRLPIDHCTNELS